MMIKRTVIAAALAAGLIPQTAEAFCGFYVGGAGQKLFNDATMVVMMREGTRTVLSMQNSYKGPAQDFAMVVPVPVVLKETDVKTLPAEVFDHVDALAAPRLVEYWEEDPCAPRHEYDDKMMMPTKATRGEKMPDTPTADLGVKIEAQFTVGEYQVVILSARDSQGLDTWLRQEKYNIPEGAEAVLKPYVAAGMKFFVAKVDVEKVKMVDGQAVLSPLRFHYDTEKFELPVRLGLLSSSGTQDLIVHILARGQRYETKNYKSVFIPTNLGVAEKARGEFGPFYAALFDATLEKNPGSVITEYSWDASSCDPCPTPPLGPEDLATLGADVIGTEGGRGGGGFTLTRLHARYGKDTLGEDLVFTAAPPVMGGRENWMEDSKEKRKLEEGATASGMNNFQARYIIRHPWQGKIECKNPERGVWGGPPAGVDGSKGQPKAATDLGQVKRGEIQLAAYVTQDVPEIGLKAGAAGSGTGATGPVIAKDPGKGAGAKKPEPEAKKGCGCQTGQGGAGGALLVLAAMLFIRRRR